MTSRPAIKKLFDKGEFLCRQGGPAGRVFVLKSGKVQSIVIPDEEVESASEARLTRGREIDLHTKSGEMLGAEGVLMGRWVSSLVASEPTTVVDVPMDRPSMLNTIESVPEVGLSFARTLARRLVRANKSLGAKQRQAGRLHREFQGMCTDFYNLVQQIQEDAEGEDQVLQVLNGAKRCWTYFTGESGGAEVANKTRVIMASVVRDESAIGDHHKLKQGDLLCRRGDPGHSVYVLVSGRLSVRVGNELYGIVRPGEVVGEISVLLGDEEPKRVADILAEEPSVVGIIPGDQFPDLVTQHPRLLTNTCRLLAIRIKNFEQLGARGEDAVDAVLRQFKGPFVDDVTSLKRQLDMLIDEHSLPLHVESESLARMCEVWNERLSEATSQ